MARTYQQQLDDLDALIAATEAAGENLTVSVVGRTFVKRPLDELYRERRQLMALAKREARGGLDVRRIYPLG